MTTTRLTREQAMKEAYDDYPSQDNEGYQPERGSFKAGFYSAWRIQQERIDALEAELTTERHDFNQLMLASDVIEKERDELKSEVARLHEKYDHQRLVKRVSELEAALQAVIDETVEGPNHSLPEWMYWKLLVAAKMNVAMEALSQREANKCGLCTDEKPCNFEACPNDKREAKDTSPEGEMGER